MGLIASALVMALVAASCWEGAKQHAGVPGGTAHKGGMYRTAVEDFGFTASFDPTGEQVLTAGILYGALLRNLVSYKHTAGPAGGTLSPDLAQALPHVSSDGLTYSFKLKPSIRFGPPVNRAITSKDIEYAFERIDTAPLVAGYGLYYDGVVKGMDGRAPKPSPVSGIETPDGSTIVFHLTRPTGDFLYRLAMPATAPVPHEVAKCFTKAGDYGRYVISSGPYMLKGSEKLNISSCSAMRPIAGFDPSKQITMVRNPNYVQSTDDLRANNIDGIQISLDANVDDIFSRIESGSLDGSLVGSPPKTVLRTYLTNPAKRRYLHVNQGDGTFFLPMNLTVPPFDDLHVRRAVNLILDKAALLQAWGGPVIGRIATHIVPPTVLNAVLGGDYDPYATPGHHGDVGKAREELKKSSRYDRDHDGICDVPQCANLVMMTRNTEPWTTMEPIVVQGLDKLGIKVTPREQALGAFLTALLTPANKIPIALGIGWFKDYPDAFTLESGFLGRSIVPAGNSNASLVGLTRSKASELGITYPTGGVPTVDADIDTCESILGADPDRNRCWANLNKKLMEQVVPWVPQVWPNALTVTAPSVTRYDFDQYAGGISLTQIAVANRVRPRP